MAYNQQFYPQQPGSGAYQNGQMRQGQAQMPNQYQQQQVAAQIPQDVVSGEQYRYALQNFRIAHEKVEQQRLQLEEQERQVAQLREKITKLEGGSGLQIQGPGGNTVDDFSIKNAASQLDKLINRWAADIIRAPPAPLRDICNAILADVASVHRLDGNQVEGTPMQIQCYLRHAIAETISEGIINCLIVTNSSEANVQLARIHEHIFARDPTVASVWRRQTFSAAVDACTPDMSLSILYEHIPELMKVLNNILPSSGGVSILDSAYTFSRMLHSSGSSDAFYRAFVPELGSTLYPRQIELVKRCMKSERGELDRVGATIFPGLVKVTKGLVQNNGMIGVNLQTVVRRAQVVCECALGGAVGLGPEQLEPYEQQHHQDQDLELPMIDGNGIFMTMHDGSSPPPPPPPM